MRNGVSTQFCPEKLGLRCFQGASSSIRPQASQLVLRGTGHSEVGAPGHKVISVSSQPDVSDKTLCHIPEMMPIFSAVSAGCIYTACGEQAPPAVSAVVEVQQVHFSGIWCSSPRSHVG